jgi:flagellar M-ring protein FliF
MEVVQNLIKQLREILSKLSVAQQVLFGLAGAGILIAGIAVALLGGRTDWRLLYGRLDAAEVGRIVSVLESQKIPHRIVSGGNAIQVSAEQVHSVRAQLAAKGMPKADGTGFEIFDKPAFGMSDFVQRANYVRALQGELARTLQQIDGVENARVMIVLPENRLVIDAQRKATASVFLNVRMAGLLTQEAVSAIRFLVSNSVEGLQARDVTVVDNYGAVLSEPSDESSGASAVGGQLQQRKNIERYLTEKLRSMFETILGPGQAVVRVSAEISFDAVTRTSEYYDPAGSVPKNQKRTQEITDSVNPIAGGVAGVVANTGTNLNAAGSQGSRLQKIDQTDDFYVSRSQTNVVAGIGGLRKISAAVFVNQRYEGKGADRKAVPRTQTDIDKLKRAAERALGLTKSDEALGDVAVEELPFNEEPKIEETARMDREALWIKGMEAARIGGMLLGSFLILFLLWRMLRRGSEEMIAAGVPVGQLMAGQQMILSNGVMVAATGVGAVAGAAGVPGAPASGAAKAEGDGAGDDEDSEAAQEQKKKMKMDFGLSKQRPERVTLEVLKDLIRDNPQKMTQAARAWLTAKPEEDGE